MIENFFLVFNETLYCKDIPLESDWKKVKHSLPWGRRTSTSHSAWSLKWQEELLRRRLIYARGWLTHQSYDGCLQAPYLILTVKGKQQHRSDVIITKLYSGEKRNKWRRGFVMMISLRALGNCVTIVMCFSRGLKCRRITRRTRGTATYWWQRGDSAGRRREVRPALTLLSSGCTLHKYKEEGACLPTQQKGWGQYTSVGQDQKICKTWG